jgi:hypothetical protein
VDLLHGHAHELPRGRRRRRPSRISSDRRRRSPAESPQNPVRLPILTPSLGARRRHAPVPEDDEQLRACHFTAYSRLPRNSGPRRCPQTD